MDLGPDLIFGKLQLPGDLHELRLGRGHAAAGIPPLGRHLKHERGLENLTVEAERAGERALSEAGVLIARDLGVEAGKDLVFGETLLDEQLLPLQREPLKLGPRREGAGQRLLEHGGSRSDRIGQGWHPSAAREQRLAGRIAVEHREVDRGLLHGAVGLHDHRLTEGDILLVIDPLDVGHGPAIDAEPDFHVALHREIHEVVGGPATFAAGRPVPVAAGGGPHVVEAAAQDHGLRQRNVDLRLGPRGPGPVDVAVLRERHREAAAEFAGISGESLEVVGGKIAVPGAVAAEEVDAAVGEELLHAEVGAIVFVGAGGEGGAGAGQIRIKGAHGAREPAGGDPALALHRLQQRVVEHHALEHFAERERGVALVGDGAGDRRFGGGDECRAARHPGKFLGGRRSVVRGDVGEPFEQVVGRELLRPALRGRKLFGRHEAAAGRDLSAGREFLEQLPHDDGIGGGRGLEGGEAAGRPKERGLGGVGRCHEEQDRGDARHEAEPMPGKANLGFDFAGLERSEARRRGFACYLTLILGGLGPALSFVIGDTTGGKPLSRRHSS